jgi:excisionase family DNA binding protein
VSISVIIYNYVPICLRHSNIKAKVWSAEMARKKIEKKNQDIERIFFTFSEAQEFLGVSHQTIYKLMKKGLPSHKIANKRVFLKEDLIKWIKEH